MADCVIGAHSNGGYNVTTYNHTPAAEDDFAIIITWHGLKDAGYKEPTDMTGVTYGGLAATKVIDGWGCEGTTRNQKVTIFYVASIPTGVASVVATPPGGYRCSVVTLTCHKVRKSSPTGTTEEESFDGKGGTFTATLNPTAVGSLCVAALCTYCKTATATGMTMTESIVHDDGDDAWDSGFYVATTIADAALETCAWGGWANELRGGCAAEFKYGGAGQGIMWWF